MTIKEILARAIERERYVVTAEEKEAALKLARASDIPEENVEPYLVVQLPWLKPWQKVRSLEVHHNISFMQAMQALRKARLGANND